MLLHNLWNRCFIIVLLFCSVKRMLYHLNIKETILLFMMKQMLLIPWNILLNMMKFIRNMFWMMSFHLNGMKIVIALVPDSSNLHFGIKTESQNLFYTLLILVLWIQKIIMFLILKFQQILIKLLLWSLLMVNQDELIRKHVNLTWITWKLLLTQ